LFNTNPRRTILTGRLVGAKVNAFGGNPLTIISPTRFINRLKNPPFEVTTIVTG